MARGTPQALCKDDLALMVLELWEGMQWLRVLGLVFGGFRAEGFWVERFKLKGSG